MDWWHFSPVRNPSLRAQHCVRNSERE